ncbi:DUF4352 domain-containing protein [Nocardiopsis dassonvillei]|uniref:DUF4352 domain-containing protein n=1 Tax=Nocardiopsis dassonvillei TaxID=2014 RepID=UPI00363C350F
MSYPQYPSGPQQPPRGDGTGGYQSYGGQPGYGAPGGGQPGYGDPSGGQPPYGGPGGPPPGQPPYGGMPPGGPGDPYGPPPGGQPPKKGMSTGAKVGLGIGGGCLGLVLIVVIVIVIIASMAGGDDSTSTSTSSAPTQQEGTQEPEGGSAEEPANEQGVTLTATAAGTAGDTIDDTVYTVLDVELTNNGDEPLDINPLYFTTVLSDGTERTDWADAIFADIQHIEVGTLAPGSSVSGQIAVVGEVVVTEVRYDPSFGMEDPIVTTVQ